MSQISRFRLNHLILILISLEFIFFNAIAANAEESSTAEIEFPSHWKIQNFKESVFNSNIFIAEIGDNTKPAVILIHGLGHNGLRDWTRVIPALENDYYIIAMDLPGFGRSDAPLGKYSPTNYARVVHALKNAKLRKPASIVGHSMGAAIALRFAAMYPADTNKLILVSAAGILERSAFIKANAAGFASNTLGEEAYGITELLTSAGLELADQFYDPSQTLGTIESLWADAFKGRSIANAGLALVNENFSDAIFGYKGHVELIWGDLDTVAPLRTIALLEAQLPSTRTQIIHGAAHVPMASHTLTFNQTLRSALSALDTVNTTASATSNRFSSKLNANILQNKILNIFKSKASTEDIRCINNSHKYISGIYQDVVIENCNGLTIENLQAESLTINDSSVSANSIVINGKIDGMVLNNARVKANNIFISGFIAVTLSDSRLDIAGADIKAKNTAILVKNKSQIILSISKVKSSHYSGNAHGHFNFENAVIDKHLR